MFKQHTYIWFIIISFLLISACKADLDRQTEKPINTKKMVDVLYDLHISEGVKVNIYRSPFKLEYNEKSVYNHILDKHQITDSLLASSITYYSSFPKVFEEIYAEVIQRLSIKNEELKKLDEEKKKKLLQLEELRQKQLKDSLGQDFADSVKSLLTSFSKTADSLSISLDSLLKSQDSITNFLRSRAGFLKVNIDSLLQTIDSTYQLPVDTLIKVNTITKEDDLIR